MPKIILVYPTSEEASPILHEFIPHSDLLYIHRHNPNIYLNISGAGIPNTCLTMGKLFSMDFDLAFQMGIAGTFSDDFESGNMVRVQKDFFYELGAEDGDAFIPADGLNIGIQTSFSEKISHVLPDFLEALPKAEGITVQKIHGNELSIKKAKELFPSVSVESMEGAAFFMGNSHRKTVLQIRAVSNKIEKRNKSKWKINEAVENLNTIAQKIIRHDFA
ncbi:MAG: hypothetical protein N3F09_07135 [Bacteroidia bacterium]|nr:hypothetical protein [Bacteroidia bacterium]